MLVPTSDRPLAVALLVFLAELGSKLNCLKPTLQPVSLPAAASCLSDSSFPLFPRGLPLLPHLIPSHVDSCRNFLGHSSPPGQMEFSHALL